MKMGFLQEDIIKEQPIVPETFTNAICYGQTGSGKTTGFMLPNIENRIKLGHGILIYDFKGNFHNQVKYLAKKHNKLDKVYEIGKPWGVKVDILKHSSSKTLQTMFTAISGRKDQSDYWGNSAYNLFENIYFLLKHLTNCIKTIELLDKDVSKFDSEDIASYYEPTIKTIAKHTRSPKAIKDFFEQIDCKIKFIDTITIEYLIKEYYYSDKNIQIIAKLMRYLEKTKERFEANEEFSNISTSSGENGGNNGVLQVLNNTLKAIANKDCFSKHEFDIVDNLLDGNIIIIDVSSFNIEMLNFLNISISNRLIQQTAISTNKNPVTIFIDEAQKVINYESMPDVDICRENKFEFILSTQDKMLLESQIGTHNIDVLLKNIVSQYSFKTTEPQDSDINTIKLNKFEYVDLIKNTKIESKPIFLEDDDLFDVEYEYQKIQSAFNIVKLKTRKKFILKYNTSIYDGLKALIYYKSSKLMK